MQRSYSGGDRKYRIKVDNLGKLNGVKDFKSHLIQEGIKQILFADGSERIEEIEEAVPGISERFITSHGIVPKEMIRFLLDCEIIEEYKFE